MYEDPRVCGYGPRRNPWEDQTAAVETIAYLEKELAWIKREDPSNKESRYSICSALNAWNLRRKRIETWLSEHPELAEAWKVEGA